jgi:hypothetical protein
VKHAALAFLRLAGAAYAFFMAWNAFRGDASPPFVVLIGLLNVVPAALAVQANADRQTRVELTPQGIRYYDWNRWHFVSYADIVDVRDTGDGIELDRGSGDAAFLAAPRATQGKRGLTPGERVHLIEQIRDGARRARGEGPPEPELVAGDILARQPEEGARAWLERLDATARMIADGTGYRGSTLSKHDLWNALVNHDANADVRAGAARMLIRVGTESGARDRIDAVLASVRDKTVSKRIRIALEPDLDDATREFEEIEDVPAQTRRA